MRNKMLTAALAATLSLPASADTLKFEAVWSSGTGSNIVSKPLPKAKFIKKGEQLTQQGLRLIDVETKVVDGKRKYAGLWIGGQGTNLFEGPIGPVPFGKSMKAKRKQGLRLVDFEIFRTKNGGRRYLGVWRPGRGEEILTGRMQQKAFLARGEKLTKQGLRLKDVEIERINGKLMYTGLFQSGSGTNLITSPKTRAKFIQQRDKFAAKNIELIDVERIRRPGPDRFVGVWASGSGESRLSVPRTFNKFVEFGEAQTQKGMRTQDMEMMRTASKNAPTEPEQPNPDTPSPVLPDLPDNPPNVGFNNGNILTVDFNLVDGLAQLDLPVNHLPQWLPRPNGDVLLPDAFCGLNLLKAGSIFWQTLGNNAVDQFPFLATPDVSSLGSDLFLGGVEFGGPIGDCAGPTQEWEFPEPFLAPNPPPFEPLENMTLRVQFGSGDGKIRFKANGQPNGQTLKAHELYKPQTYNALLQMLEAHDPSGPNTAYCDGVDDYFIQVCAESPGECPVDNGTPPSC